jgi:GT2 family glycosyltransferase
MTVSLRSRSIDAMAQQTAVAPVSAIVTAFDRIGPTLETLRILKDCRPAAAQILVHVDGNQRECADAIRSAHADVIVLVSAGSVGPGGGRNALVASATQAIVASFDDDSYPLDRDYFARVAAVFERLPDASVVGGHVYHRHEAIAADTHDAAWVADFSGGACAYRRDHFLETGGYVPVTTAYGMEEVDLALRLHARGRRVLQTPWLRVFHDTDLARHADPGVTAASVSNIALLAYLRYPVSLWAVGAAQVLRRIAWLLVNGRHRGVLRGLANIPAHLRAHGFSRCLVSASAVRSYLRLRRHPVPVQWGSL